MPIISIATPLDPGFAALASAARAEGYWFLNRLHTNWNSGDNRFARQGEVLLGAGADGTLIGVGGVNVDPYAQDQAMARLRHVYVHPDHRRLGLGMALVRALVEAVRVHFRCLRLRTANPEAARLYERMGFSAVSQDEVTHTLVL